MTNIKRYVMAVYTNFGADGYGEAGWHECQYINAASEDEAREIATYRVIEQSEPGTVVEVVIVAAVVDANDPCIYDTYGAIQRWIEETETNTETETNEKWVGLIREHYGEVTDEITKRLWDGFLKIRYTRDDDDIIRGAVASDPITGFEMELDAPAYGGLWVDGRQRIGHCDFSLTGQNANRRRILRGIAFDYYNEYKEMRGF